jgi:hypothetical protein
MMRLHRRIDVLEKENRMLRAFLEDAVGITDVALSDAFERKGKSGTGTAAVPTNKDTRRVNLTPVDRLTPASPLRGQVSPQTGHYPLVANL